MWFHAHASKRNSLTALKKKKSFNATKAPRIHKTFIMLHSLSIHARAPAGNFSPCPRLTLVVSGVGFPKYRAESQRTELQQNKAFAPIKTKSLQPCLTYQFTTSKLGWSTSLKVMRHVLSDAGFVWKMIQDELRRNKMNEITMKLLTSSNFLHA
jgi:hypothetical protein